MDKHNSETSSKVKGNAKEDQEMKKKVEEVEEKGKKEIETKKKNGEDKESSKKGEKGVEDHVEDEKEKTKEGRKEKAKDGVAEKDAKKKTEKNDDGDDDDGATKSKDKKDKKEDKDKTTDKKSNGKLENPEDPSDDDDDSKSKTASSPSPSKDDSSKKDKKEKGSVDKITVDDGSEILVTLNPDETPGETKENESSKEESKKDKTVIKLTDDDDDDDNEASSQSKDDEDDVQFLSEEHVGQSGQAVEINLAENSLRDIAQKTDSSNNKWNRNGQCHSSKSNSLPNSYNSLNSKSPYSSSSSMSQQNSPYTPVLGSNSMNKSGYASCSSSSPFSPNLNDTDDSKDQAPTSSMQQIEAIKRETLLHSMSVKMQRILKERAKAELLKKVDEPLGPLANFLNNLGLDIVKQSVYQEAIHIQSRKQQASKLTDTECSQLDKMRTSCKELTMKLHHLRLGYRKCKLCNFVSESVNVHFWHREHPHINRREDLCCSYCDFVTRNNVAFNFHMEAEHNIRGRSMDKPSFWQCTLCPFEHNSKTKLTQHKFKCEKIFELKTHLAPSPETDINYSLYGVFYLSEKEEALKAIALHKAKQAQLKAQQAQFKLQQQQAAAQRANYFNANKISPMHSSQGNMNQRYPMMVHSKTHGMQSNMQGSQNRANCYQHPSHIRSPMVRPPNPTMKQFNSTRGGSIIQNHYRGSSMGNQGMNNSNLMHSRLPVKDLINMNQSSKTQNMMGRSVGNQKYLPNSHANDVSAFETCELCNGYVKDRNALRIHLFYAHKVEMPALMFEKPNPPLFCDVCDRKFWTSQGLQKHRVLLKHYAKGSLSQVCIVCGCQVTHLLNHMTNTHQINLQDFLNQKRCIVCGIVCQSRSGTEIHMASSHGILVKHSNTNSYETTKKCTTTPYNMGHKSSYSPSPTQAKGHYCMFCKIPFPTSMELNRHRLLAHKSCPRCSMVLPNAQALAHHKCQMRVLTKKVCKVCKQQIPLLNFIRHVQERHLKKYRVNLKRVSSDKISCGIKEKIIHVDLTDEPSSPTSQDEDDGDQKVRDLPPNFTLPKQKFDPLRMKRKRPLDPEDYYPTTNSESPAKSRDRSADKTDSNNLNKKSEEKSACR